MRVRCHRCGWRTFAYERFCHVCGWNRWDGDHTSVPAIWRRITA